MSLQARLVNCHKSVGHGLTSRVNTLGDAGNIFSHHPAAVCYGANMYRWPAAAIIFLPTLLPSLLPGWYLGHRLEHGDMDILGCAHVLRGTFHINVPVISPSFSQ